VLNQLRERFGAEFRSSEVMVLGRWVRGIWVAGVDVRRKFWCRKKTHIFFTLYILLLLLLLLLLYILYIYLLYIYICIQIIYTQQIWPCLYSLDRFGSISSDQKMEPEKTKRGILRDLILQMWPSFLWCFNADLHTSTYPLVNVYKKLWKDPPFSSCK